MIILQRLILISLAAIVASCGKEPTETERPIAKLDDANTVALVDGSPITIADRTLHLQQRSQRSQTADLNEITQELINLKVLVINAMKTELHEREDVKAKLQQQSDTMLANLYIQEIVQSIEITDEDLANEYEAQVAQMATQEYDASHILLETEAAALAVIQRLDGGEEFGRVASEESIGPSAENGGELGWFRPESMAPGFSAAVVKLEKGKYTKRAVNTQFGWHVIRLNDTRPVQQPTFDQVKDQIHTALMNNRLNDYVRDLRSKSTIEIKQP
jgi:peptidyl-prolyl cis-trans isomerase C